MSEVTTAAPQDDNGGKKKNEKSVDEIVRMEPVKVPTTGQFTVSLLQVNNKRYPNYRKTLREEHAKELFTSIKADGQLQSCAGSWSDDGSKIDLWGGFSRFEVMQRIALEKLVREYNESMKKQVGDDGFIPLGGAGFGSQAIREKIREASPEWQAKYDAALASYKIKFDVAPVENDDDAAIKGVATNVYDKPPLSDLCAQVEALCSREGVTAGRIAKVMGVGDSQISHYRKINRLPGLLRENFAKADLVKELGITDPAKVEVERGVLELAVKEFERRLALEQTDPQSVSFSHARALANEVENKKDPLSIAGQSIILKKLVRINQAGNATELSTPDWTDFNLQLKDARKVGKMEVEVAAGVVAGATVPPPAAAVTLSTMSKEQQEAIDKAAEAAVAATATPAVVTPNAVPAPVLSAEEKAKQEALKVANEGGAADAGDAEDIDLDDIVPAADQLAKLAAEDSGASPIAPVVATGQLAGKPKDAPEDSRYKPKAPEKIEKLARGLVADAGSGAENVTLVDQCAYLFGAVQMFDGLTMTDEADKCNECYANFTEGVVAYITAMEEFIKSDAVSDAVKAPILAQRPVWVHPFPKPSAAA